MLMTGKTPDGLYVATVSDIHLGHRRNPTHDIVKNLYAAFPDNAETARLDIIWLAGDVFDDQMTFSHQDIAEIQAWMTYMLRLCKKHDILLRVLEGTPSHDWWQSRNFVSLNEVSRIGCDLAYFESVAIEYIPKFDIHVLYIPDDSLVEQALETTHELMRAKGITQVDFAIMHGQFEYQLPPLVKAPKHKEADYLKITKELIFIGHVHIHTRYERILAQGSFDRLTHGEEGPKGHLRAFVRSNGERDITFVENVTAKKFITVRCGVMDLQETLDEIARRVNDLPVGSFVRVEADSENPIFTNMDTLIRRYPLFTWSKLPRVAEAETIQAEVSEEEVVFVPIVITESNIRTLLMERISRQELNGEVMQCAQRLLEEVI